MVFLCEEGGANQVCGFGGLERRVPMKTSKGYFTIFVFTVELNTGRLGGKKATLSRFLLKYLDYNIEDVECPLFWQ